MTGRRDFLLGAGALGAAGLAYGLKPRRRVTLLGDRKMEAIVPRNLGFWVATDDGALVKPETEGKLAARLYSELVSRRYVQQETGEQVMMLIAYGDTQSDLLQLHRPESCYPAVGFKIASTTPVEISVAGRASIPGRRVVAEMSGRRENILYWTRLGEYLPSSPGAQREARFKTALQGYIPDGGLFRFSALGDDESMLFERLGRFVSELVEAVGPTERDALVGTALARRLA